MGYCGWFPYVNKWYTFVASISVALCCGLTYTFAIWSGALKSKYGLDQEQLQLIASAANVGGYSAIFSGVVYDALEKHKKFGPRFVLTVGCVFNALGYFGLWAAVKGLFQARLWHLVALAALAANGGTWGDTAILTTNIRNFPSFRGSVVGTLKAGIGLSGSLFACVYTGAFSPDKESFLLFLALSPLVLGLVALPFINHCSFVQVSELQLGQHVFSTEGRFIFSLQALGALAVYLITTATLEPLYPLPRTAHLAFMVVAGLLLLPLLLIPLGSGGVTSQKAEVDYTQLQHYQEEEEEQQHVMSPSAHAPAASAAASGNEDTTSALSQPLLGSPGVAMQRYGATERVHRSGNAGPADRTAAVSAAATPPPPLPEMSPWDCLRSASFWLLFLVLVIGLGAGLTLLNNMAQIVKALTGGASASEATPVLVSLFSVCNCAGRMALGYAPEKLLHARGTPRLLFLPLVSGLMAGTCLGLAFGGMALLYPLAALAGFAFGGHWSLFPSLVSELFGLARFAANYTLVQLAPAVGSFGLAMGLAGSLYERALSKHGSGSNTCVGQDCFQLTFLILSGLGVAATCCSVLLYRRERDIYQWHARQLHSYDEEVLREDGCSSVRSV